MAAKAQISAIIDFNLKQRLERYARESGLSQTKIIEAALRHLLDALEQ